MEIKTREEARNYFKKLGLNYEEVNQQAIDKLKELISEECENYLNEGTPHAKSMDMKISKKELKRNDGPLLNKRGGIDFALINVRGSYFDRREAVCFNEDGFIGFCGWADNSNKMPILKAFERWCNWMTLKSKKKGCGVALKNKFGISIKCGEKGLSEIAYCEECSSKSEEKSE